MVKHGERASTASASLLLRIHAEVLAKEHRRRVLESQRVGEKARASAETANPCVEAGNVVGHEAMDKRRRVLERIRVLTSARALQNFNHKLRSRRGLWRDEELSMVLTRLARMGCFRRAEENRCGRTSCPRLIRRGLAQRKRCAGPEGENTSGPTCGKGQHTGERERFLCRVPRRMSKERSLVRRRVDVDEPTAQLRLKGKAGHPQCP
mgnify:CR=1 FL=1|mmetsp:Transcript_17068/g.51629  ORF Transcript_17068/g.51629 Transcript_17068/m.51629 type:complete len:208 (-) Transcript_17068:1300-1923(-)